MLGDYIKDPSWGLGKVIKLRPGNELVYFFKANDSLHDGAIEPWFLSRQPWLVVQSLRH